MLYADASITKQQLRAHYREKRNSIAFESSADLDAAIRANILELDDVKHAKTVLMFYPIKSEPNVLALVKSLRDLGKKVAFPISNSDDCTLTFRYVNDVQDMVAGTYNIPEPSQSAPIVEDFSHSVCLVPALVFDKYGYRLGYGKGYYDRFLKDFSGRSIGIAYSDFIADSLPNQDTDMAVDMIITERGNVIPYETKSKEHQEYRSQEKQTEL